MKNHVTESFNEALDIMRSFISDTENIEKTVALSRELAEAYRQGHKSIIAGNGGSNCDALHFAQEFTGRFRGDRKPLPSISLGDSSHITCVSNDYGFEDIFARGLEALGKKGDIFFALSTSGNSPNIIKGVLQAKRMGLTTVGLLGKDGGKLKGMCTYEFIIPGKTSDRIQEIHMLILHTVIEMTERILFPENYNN